MQINSSRAIGRKSVAIVIMSVVIGAVACWHGWICYQLVQWRSLEPETTAFIERHTGTVRRQWVDYDHISVHLKRAVIAAEDASFVSHHGFDWQGIKVAMEKNIKQGRIAAGGSTITQQLAKNLFLNSDRSLLRKAKETSIALLIEASLSKRRILELYLNFAEWGDGIYGAEAAARHHFGVPASLLSAWQAARLAAMLPDPKYYDRNRTRWLQNKTQIVLQRMPKVRIP